jgi:hypothetical protein
MRRTLGARRQIQIGFVALLMIASLASTITSPLAAQGDGGLTTLQALQVAESTGSAVVATAETTESSLVIANPDGSVTASIADGPVREPDPTDPGHWNPIDLSLVRGEDGFAPTVAAADVVFSDGGSGELASIDEEAKVFSEEWGSPLPAPTISDNRATYSNVLPGIDLQLTAQTTGFEQSFIIHSAPSEALVLDIPLSLRGLKASTDEGGGLILTDRDGNQVLSAGTATMFGAATDPISGEPTVSDVLQTEVTKTSQGPVLRVRPDPAFFDDPNLTYPVTVDPAPNLSVTTDTYVQQSTPTSSYSTENVLKVGSPNGSNVDRALLQFPTISLNATGLSVQVSSASLNLYETDSGSCTPSEVDVYDPSDPWDSSVTWNSKPSAETLYASTNAAYGYDASCPAQWVGISDGGQDGLSLDVLVQSWVDGSPNDGLLVMAASENTTSGWKKFKSSEASGSHAPTLSVTYNLLPDDSSLRAETSSGTVTLHATVTTAASSAHMQYAVFDQMGDQVLTGDGPDVSSGSDSPYSFSLTNLEADSEYTWQARIYDGNAVGAWSAIVDGQATPDSTDSMQVLRAATRTAYEIVPGSGDPSIVCNGWNRVIPAQPLNEVGVSWTCQRQRVGTGTWTIMGSALEDHCNACVGVDWQGTRFTACPDTTYNYLVRAHVDGWWKDEQGHEQDYPAPINSSPLYFQCSGTGGPSPQIALSTMIGIRGTMFQGQPVFWCGGLNQFNPVTVIRDVFVSYVCQVRHLSGGVWGPWHNFGKIGHIEARSSASTSGRTAINCGNLGNGSGVWQVRARADGWWRVNTLPSSPKHPDGPAIGKLAVQSTC